MIVQTADTPTGEPPRTLRVVRRGERVSPDERRAGLVALYEAEFRPTAKLAYLLCGNSQQADDLTHDAFVRLYEHWERVQDPSKRLAYLRAIVVNLARSAHRRDGTAERHRGAPALAEAGAARSAEDEAVWRSSRPDVMAALAELPDRQRTAVVLRHWVRMTESEIADAMDCSVGSVRTHIARGHHALAARLGDIR